MSPLPHSTDLAIVGAGAAGLAAALFARRAHPRCDLVLLDGARQPGAKILVSGGGRCNVTNTVVSERDFWGGARPIVRRILKALTVRDTIAFFAELGVALHEEPGGKLFPNSNRARDVLDALLRGATAAGAVLASGVRVHDVRPASDGFVLETSDGPLRARAVLLATGGRSLPKTGSDGGGYAIAERLGHTLVAQTPALVPLLLSPGSPYGIHAALSGIAIDASLTVWVDNAVSTRLSGSLLWTHFGISGPLALNASRHWARATLDGHAVRLTLNFCGDRPFEQVDAAWIATASARPSATVRSTLAGDLPDAVAVAVLDALPLAREQRLATLARDERRRLVHALTEWPLPVTGTRGYNYAEVTAGGVPLTDIDPATMESRLCPGLYFAGEILDVDGRIGGFNFQWAWCTAALAGRAAVNPGAARSSGPPATRGSRE